MSGGSWNYLYSKDIDELMNYSTLEDLQGMADRMIFLGYEDIAKDTQRLVEYIKSAKLRIETLSEILSPVFKAVEWFDSGDYCKETMIKVLEEYRKGATQNGRE